MKISIQSFAVFTFTLATFALQPIVQAVVPPPDGGYPGGNTAEGQNALLSLTTGGFNTALGFLSLRSDTDGSFNTAVGAGTLLMNTGENNTAVGAGALYGSDWRFHPGNKTRASAGGGSFQSWHFICEIR
jgi:hypothetical protein